MPDTLMYDEEAYVFLDTDQPEELLSPTDLQDKLTALLQAHPGAVPPDVQNLPTVTAQVEALMATWCELSLSPDRRIQWYVVRLEK